MRIKRAGIGVKFVILVLLALSVTSVLSVNRRLESARLERDELAQTVEEQKEINESLADDIENSSDPDRIESVAREKLGLVGQNEIVFEDTSK